MTSNADLDIDPISVFIYFKPFDKPETSVIDELGFPLASMRKDSLFYCIKSASLT